MTETLTTSTQWDTMSDGTATPVRPAEPSSDYLAMVAAYLRVTRNDLVHAAEYLSDGATRLAELRAKARQLPNPPVAEGAEIDESVMRATYRHQVGMLDERQDSVE